MRSSDPHLTTATPLPRRPTSSCGAGRTVAWIGSPDRASNTNSTAVWPLIQPCMAANLRPYGRYRTLRRIIIRVSGARVPSSGNCLALIVYQLCGTLFGVPPTKSRIQVTIDNELAGAVAEFGSGKSRSRAVHDLALRGAEAIRAEKRRLQESLEFLQRLDAGEDDRFDFSVSARLHAER
jgi:hypothetical protein